MSNFPFKLTFNGDVCALNIAKMSDGRGETYYDVTLDIGGIPDPEAYPNAKMQYIKLANLPDLNSVFRLLGLVELSAEDEATIMEFAATRNKLLPKKDDLKLSYGLLFLSPDKVEISLGINRPFIKARSFEEILEKINGINKQPE